MDIWNVRNQSLAILDDTLRQERETLDQGFALLDECINRFYEVAMQESELTRFAAICGQTLVKARRLALGIYSLCLDGLILEAGALMRVLKEAWQLLIYFHQDPSRVELAFAEKLPKAGEIAKAIDRELHNQLKGLTEYYNAITSHISFHEDALVPVSRDISSENLKGNMRSLDTVICHILYEGVAPCLTIIGKLDSVLAGNVDTYREMSLTVFDTDEEPEQVMP